MSQNNEVISKPKNGDWVAFHYTAYAISNNNNNTKNKKKEFCETRSHSKMGKFQLGDKKLSGLYVGLSEAILTMNFGEEAKLTIPAAKAFGTEGLSKANEPLGNKAENMKPDHKFRNPLGVSYVPIGPNEDIEVHIQFMKMTKDGQWHFRKIESNDSLCDVLYKCLFCGYGWSSS